LIADPAPVPRAQVALQFFPLRSTLAAKFKLTRKIRTRAGSVSALWARRGSKKFTSKFIERLSTWRLTNA